MSVHRSALLFSASDSGKGRGRNMDTAHRGGAETQREERGNAKGKTNGRMSECDNRATGVEGDGSRGEEFGKVCETEHDAR